MSFVDKLQRARQVLEQQSRLSTRALERELAVEGDELEAIIEELVDIQHVARRDGAAARAPAEAALADAAALIERTGAQTLAPALCEWRAELAAVLGDDATRVQLLRQAQQGYEAIGAPKRAVRIEKERAE